MISQLVVQKKGANLTCFQTCLNRKKPIIIHATKHHITTSTKLLRKGHPKLITMQRQRARLTNHRREAVKYSSPSESNALIHKGSSELVMFPGGWILIHSLRSLVYTVSIYFDKLDADCRPVDWQQNVQNLVTITLILVSTAKRSDDFENDYGRWEKHLYQMGSSNGLKVQTLFGTLGSPNWMASVMLAPGRNKDMQYRYPTLKIQIVDGKIRITTNL